MKHSFIIGILTLLLAACSSAKPQFIGIDNWVFGDLEDTQLTASMDYVIYNPNTTTYTLKSSEVDLYYEGSLVGRGTLKNKVVLRPKDSLKLPMDCIILLDKLSRFQKQLLGSDSISLHAKGTNRIGFLGGTIALKIDEEVHLNVKKLIAETLLKEENPMSNFAIKQVSVDRLPSLNSTTFKLEIETENTLPFDYSIEALRLDFHVDPQNRAVAQWHSEEPILIKKQGNMAIPLEVNINNFSMAQQSKLSWFVKGKATLYAKGEVRISLGKYAFDFPLSKEIEANLNPFMN
ncbi:LEA type 2 family protein [Spongiimicrobium salis]|uniref:LEA type 2 family protein n=1 Tax=Spongiimicrobium salis TaxID=1667022 RepID=UPI00374D95E0